MRAMIARRPRPAALVTAVLAVVALLGGPKGLAGVPAEGAVNPVSIARSMTVTGAAAAGDNLAGVVIDDDSGTIKTTCVGFSEASISGEELLRRAMADPVFAKMGSLGSAVCSLCGTGCPAENCFCDSSRFWNYSTDSGSSWSRSSMGASSRRLSSGDADGWAWGGDGAQPPYASFTSICADELAAQRTAASPSPSPAPPPASPSPATRPSPAAQPPLAAQPPPASNPGSGSGPGANAPAEAASPPPGTVPPTTSPGPTVPSPTTSASPSPSTNPSDPGVTFSPTPTATPTPGASASPTLAADTAGSEDGSGTTASLIAFAALLAIIGGAVWWRRAR